MKKETKQIESMSAKEAEFAILKVAFLLTAIDGHIDESERAMFDKLVERCREVDVDEAKIVLASVDSATKRMLKAVEGSEVGFHHILAGLSGIEGRLKLFMDEVEVVCNWNVFVRDSARVRRAFVMWTAMVMADGDYSEMERKAISALRDMVNSKKLIGAEFLSEVESEIEEINKLSVQLQSAGTLEEDRKLHDAIDSSFETLSKMIQG